MKKTQFVIGIDVSKKTLDLCLLAVAGPSDPTYLQVANNPAGHLKILKWLGKCGVRPQEALFLLEHTGMYSLAACLFLEGQSLGYCLISGLALKRSLGICRGKDDRKDAHSIARYGYLHREQLKPSPVKEDRVAMLQLLFGQRRRMVTALKSLQTVVKEAAGMGLREQAASLEESQAGAVAALKEGIKALEKKMLALIEGDGRMAAQYRLCTSVPGVGTQLATYLLVVTHSFTRFADSRSLASFGGVAPFPYRSGTSIRGKTRTSPLADKQLKSLLHMGSLNAVRCDSQLKTYYERKKAEGKNAMLVLNAVRNKMLARIMATVKRETPYVQLDKHKL